MENKKCEIFVVMREREALSRALVWSKSKSDSSTPTNALEIDHTHTQTREKGEKVVILFFCLPCLPLKDIRVGLLLLLLVVVAAQPAQTKPTPPRHFDLVPNLRV